MAIQAPSIDDRTYEQLLEVLRRQIPTSEWTDHNASDPGVMLLELLCWLGEITLYRMNRVPDSHRIKFLNLLIDPPEPVTLAVSFTFTFGAAFPDGDPLDIPAGVRLATDFVAGRRLVFETIRPIRVHKPPAPVPPIASAVVRARELLEVIDEPLGTSNGRPNQIHRLRPPRAALGFDEDAPLPILTDFVHRSAGYEPNPQVSVAGVPWEPVPFLLSDIARVTAANPGEQYMVEPYERRIRFGDDVFGAIPPAGAEIACSYRVLQGPPALSVRSGDLVHILNLTLPADVTLDSFSHTDAEGGAGFFPDDQRFSDGLRSFRATYRLVTAADFERAVLVDFNEFQRLSADPLRIARAAAVMNRRPPLADDEFAPGNVTLLLLPGHPHLDESVFQDESVPVPVKEGMVQLPAGVWGRLRRFLDTRRLITTRLHQESPALQPLTITAQVVIDADRNAAEMTQALRDRVYRFLSLIRGDADGRGWRLGRSIYRSQLFELLEDADGVDHVASLSLSPADARGNVAIGPHQLPLVESLALVVSRA